MVVRIYRTVLFGARWVLVCFAVALLPAVAAPKSASGSPGDLVRLPNACGEHSRPGRTAMSADGRFVAFSSNADNLARDDTDRQFDVFVRDVAGTTTLVSRAGGSAGAKGNGESLGELSISADGRAVAFSSRASNLSRADRDHRAAVFVRDLATNRTTLVSRPGGARFAPVIAANGRFVAFNAESSRPRQLDNFVRDLVGRTTTLVTRATGADAARADGDSRVWSISADGRRVAFDSSGRNLSSSDADPGYDAYGRDLTTQTTTLVSRAERQVRGVTPFPAAGRSPAMVDGSRFPRMPPISLPTTRPMAECSSAT